MRVSTRAFSREQAPVVFGWVFAAHQLGAGLMAVLAGHSRDPGASYLPAFAAAGFLCLAATASLLLIRRRFEPSTGLGQTPSPA